MALTDRDIVLFARDAVFAGATSEAGKAVCARNALGCYEQALNDIRESGYRITARVRDGVLNELLSIASFRAAA